MEVLGTEQAVLAETLSYENIEKSIFVKKVSVESNIRISRKGRINIALNKKKEKISVI